MNLWGPPKLHRCEPEPKAPLTKLSPLPILMPRFEVLDESCSNVGRWRVCFLLGESALIPRARAMRQSGAADAVPSL